MEHQHNILVLNPGSATVKWARYAGFDSREPEETGQCPIANLAKQLGSLIDAGNKSTYVVRFVHGGDRFCEPVFISRDNYASFHNLSDWAPLHNRLSLQCVEMLLQSGAEPGIVAVFDTHYFRDLPLVSRSYGLPGQLVRKYHIRRYGFHGFAHQAMRDNWETQEPGRKEYALVTMQLGSGCSMAAVRDGAPIDTTMGFTPNEGLLMSTRCGDIDPGLVTWLQKREGWGPDETERVLDRESGWLGISTVSADMAEVLASAAPEAQLAVDVFCQRIRKTLGAYYALLGGLDGIVISGGIGERATDLRWRLFKNLQHLGISIDTASNREPGAKGLISSPESKVRCHVVAGNESLIMLREAGALFSSAH